MAYNDIKWFKDEAHWSQKIKNSLYLIGLGNLWEKAHFSDVGIVSIIRQRLENIELQRWFSEMNNAIKARANARNIVGQQDAKLLGPTCCERLHTMLCVVACCCDLLDEV